MKAMLNAAGLIAVCLALVGKAHAQYNVIKNSKHDFTVSYIGGGQGAKTLCSTCHEMHKPQKMEPLWARHNPSAGTDWLVNSHSVPTALPDTYTPNSKNAPGADAITNWDTYKTGSLIAMSDFLDSKSGLCLSCHDGTQPVANGIYINGSPTETSANFGGHDLSRNHALGKERGGSVYGSNPPQQVPAAVLQLNDVVVGADGVTRYFLGCTSCHGIHTSPLGNPKLLRNDYATNSGPVCWNCHAGK